MPVTAHRLLAGPIVRPHMDARMGDNINGPSVIEAPTWAGPALGRYYLYFADHKGTYIRLAYADRLEGPWRIHSPGCLDVADSLFCTERPAPPGPTPAWAEGGKDWLYPHVASPDVHVDRAERRIRMYFHGLLPDGTQLTRVAVSDDGLAFRVLPELLGPPYFRVFRHGGWHYALAFRNALWRSRDGVSRFERGPAPLDPATRHGAALLRGDDLHVFWTRLGEAPERIYHAILGHATLGLAGDWRDWRLSEPREILRPEHQWEGSDLPLEPSGFGAVDGPVNQLRDPCVFEDRGRVFLFYSGAGESGIGLAELRGL